MDNNIIEAANYLRQIYPEEIHAGVVLGTGLGGLVGEVEVVDIIPYSQIPHFPVSTVEGHAGAFIFGNVGEVAVGIMQGRFHLYEGYSPQQIALPIRVMKLLGAEILYISNISGGLNAAIRKGDLVIIDDHLNLQGCNPLVGRNDDMIGPRFPDMSEPYSKMLIQRAESIAAALGIKVHRGVYAAVIGPMLETRAEYRMLRSIGADVVGMSTVPEVIAANHLGMKTFAISLVTDECDPDNLRPVSISEILETAARSEPHLTAILLALIGHNI